MAVPVASEHAAAESLALHDYVAIARRRLWLILLIAIALPLVILLPSLFAKPSYSATAGVLIPTPNTGSQSAPTLDRRARTEASLASVPEVARRTLAAAGLKDRTPEQFTASSDVIVQPNSDVLKFRVKDRSPKLAILLANQFAKQFTIYRRQVTSAAIEEQRQSVEAEIKELAKQGQTSSPLYAALVNKDLRLRSQQAGQDTDAVVVGVADSANRVAKRPFRTAILGFGFGLILGVILAFVLEALRQTVRSGSEIGDRLQLPLLANLPPLPRRLASSNRLSMIDDPESPHAEAVRMLRTNLAFFNLELGARTIMVTSALAGDGKSTTTANLGIAVARAGQKVILVDLDLRRASLTHLFDVPAAARGITDVVLRGAPLDDALYEVPPSALEAPAPAARDDSRPAGPAGATRYRPISAPAVLPPGAGAWAASQNGDAPTTGSLVILPAGAPSSAVGEFFSHNAVTDVLQRLRQRADLVLVDTAPLLSVVDARALAGKVDALVVLVRPGVLRRPMLDELSRALDSCQATKLGYIVVGEETGWEEEVYRYYLVSRPSARSTTASEPKR